MKDWVTLLTAIIQLITAMMIFFKPKDKNKKGTKRRERRKR